jgi:hypothetical protein
VDLFNPSLGLLRKDAKVPGRWVSKVENPELVKEISSVFVTVAPAAGGKQPDGQKMLYASCVKPITHSQLRHALPSHCLRHLIKIISS